MADSTTVLTYTVKVNTAGGTASVKKVRDAFDDLSRQAKKNLSEAGQKFDGLFSKLTNLNLGLELAKKAFHLLSTPIEKIISVGSKFEDLQLQLETVLQSADRAKEYFTWIKDFAAKTPFQMEGLTESVIMLESFGIDGQKYLRTFGDAAAGLKIPLNELSRVMGQIFAKPTAQAEEMLQLTERGVPVMRILRQELGLTAAQVGNIGREGIAGQKVFEALAAGMDKLYGGAMEKMSHTWTGMMSTLKDSIDLFLAKIAGPVLENLKGKLADLLAKIDQWAADGTLERWGQQLADIIISVIDTLGKIIKILWDWKDVIFEIGKIWAVAFAVSKISPFFDVFGKGLSNIVTYFRVLKSEGKTSMESFSGAMNAAGLSATTLGAKLNALPTHVKVTMAVTTFFAGWEAGKALDKEFNISGWIQAQDDKIRPTLEAYTQLSMKKAELNEKTTALIASIREMGATLGVESGSVRANVTAIAENEVAYSRLTEEQRKFVDGMMSAINQAPNLESSLQKVTGALGYGAMSLKERIGIVLNDYQAFSTLNNDMQQQLIEAAKNYETFAQLGGNAIDYIRNKLFTMSPVLAGAAKDILNLGRSLFSSFHLFSGSQVDVSMKAQTLIDTFEKQKKSIIGNKEATETYLQKIQALKNVSPELKEKLDKITSALTNKSTAVKLVDKEFEKYIGTLKLANFGDLEHEAQLLTTALKGKEEQLYLNEEALEAVSKKVEELLKGYKALGIEPPEAIKKLKVQTDLTRKSTVDWKVEQDWFGESLDETGLKLVDFAAESNIASDAMKAGNEITNSWKYKLFELAETSGKVFTDISNYGSEVLGIMTELGIVSGETAEALGGLLDGIGQVGAGFSELATNPIGGSLKILGGVVKAVTSIIKLFAGDGIQEAIDRENSWMKLTREMNDTLHKMAEDVGSVHAATSLYLKEIMSDSLDTSNFDTYADRLREIQADVIQGTLTQQEANKAMGESFTVLLEKAKEFGKEGSYYMLQIIRQNRDMGLGVKEINDYVFSKLSENVKAITQYLNTMQGSLAENLPFIEANITQTIAALKSEGYSVLEIVDMMGDSFSILSEKMAAEGVQVSGAIKEMMDISVFIKQNETLMQNIDATTKMMIGLGDSVYMSKDLFISFGTEAQKQFQALIAAGATEKQALQILSPQFEQILKYAESYNLKIDENTQALIDQAQKEGLLNADRMSAQDKEIALLETVVELLGGKIPYEIDSLATQVSEKVGSIQRDTNAWQNSLENVQDQMGALENSIVSLDNVYHEELLGSSIVTDTEAWAAALATVDRSIYTIGNTVRLFDTEYVEVMQNIDAASREKFKGLQEEFKLTMIEMTRNTRMWEEKLADIEKKKLAVDIPEKLAALERDYRETLSAMGADSMMFESRLNEIISQLGIQLPSELDTVEEKYRYIMDLMSGDTDTLYLSVDGVLRTLREIIKLEAEAMSQKSGFSSQYGVYTEEEKIAKTTEFLAMMKVWGQNRETILGDKKNIERFYNDLLGLKGAIIDEQLENYNYWATSIGQWYRHIQRGETFDESSKTWIIPEQIKAATGFSTWLDRPTEILLGGMNGTRILAGERRREAFIIAPENSIVPVTSQVNLSQTPGKKITIKEINYSPQIIVQGAANQNIGKEEMKNMIHAILKDNYRGFVDYLAEKLKKEFK